MIHFRNLSLMETNPAATGSSSTSNSPSNLASFESALSDAISATFKQFGIDPSSVNISITPESAGSNSAPPTSTTPAGSSPATSSSPAPYDPFLQAASNNIIPAATTTPTPVSSGAPAASAAAANQVPVNGTPANDTAAGNNADPTQAFDDAYWAQQPSAVQALRNMQPEQRAAAAHSLAAEGYTIDVPIMVWGWDPSITTDLRQSFGYTWVPSALQNPVESMPGNAPLPGMTAYNPNQPPAGSIPV